MGRTAGTDFATSPPQSTASPEGKRSPTAKEGLQGSLPVAGTWQQEPKAGGRSPNAEGAEGRGVRVGSGSKGAGPERAVAGSRGAGGKGSASGGGSPVQGAGKAGLAGR